jgi:transporter family protein
MNWIIYALLSALFASLVAIFGKIGLKDIDSTLATTIRSIVMALFLVTVSFSLGKFSMLDGLNSKTLTFIALSGIAGAISWLFYFLALKLGPASAVGAIDKTSIAFVFILALLFLGESFTYMKAGGALLVVLGAILMVL